MSTRNTGVYLCSGCGIGDAVSMNGLEKVVTSEFKKSCKVHDCLCGAEGLGIIQADVADGVNQVVVAACSPRVMTDRFRFNGTQVIRGNLREQVVWSHTANEEDTQMMAEDNIRIAVTEAGKSIAPEPKLESDHSQVVLVVGGGYTGLTAAHEAAQTGYDVLLVERAPQLGGMAMRWSKRTPTRPPYKNPQPNTMADLIKTVSSHSRITIKMSCTVAKTSGMPGHFSVELSDGSCQTVGAIVVATGWRPYDAGKLDHLGYGISPDVMTSVEMETMLKDGRVVCRSDGRVPDVIVFVQCAGSRDQDHLPYCSSVCCSVSIKQALQLREANPDVMVYIVYEELRTPGVAEEFYRTAQREGIIFLKGKVKRIDASLTVLVDDALLQQEIPLTSVDLVILAIGMVPNSTNIESQTHSLDDEYATLLNNDVNFYAPIQTAGIALDPITLPPEKQPEGASILNLQYRQGPHLPVLAHGFPDSHYICFPYETRRSGIYVAGPVRRPMDMGESAEDATGATMKAIQAIRTAARGLALHPRAGDLSLPYINLNQCTKCRRCTVECPFGAIDETTEGFPSVNATRCRRCGTCMGACPVRTINFSNYTVDMLGSMIKAVNIPDETEEKPRVLALVCENDAYPALDMVGIARQSFSAHIRIVPVRCLGSVNLLLLSDALSVGYDGVILMGCKPGDDYQCHFMKGSNIAKERLSKVGETLKSMALESERVTMTEVSIADSAALPKVIQSFVETLDTIGPNPFKGF
ncbi:heterodisulfide reductase, subunit A/methylviologen reducing hydrogenase, subunit delta [invertebrate metagenome]|uniref:Heterodisulfide reductase, subunit A/methylviologen reducing hydrogenase, subunit delta n=1 Tax=invertebrate metagenome TaxID=1711999 RepID=A0A484H5Z3_9ZZZZ